MMHNMEYYMDILHMDTYNLGYRLSIMLIQNFYRLFITLRTSEYRLFIILWRTLPY